jgi:small subunit ribosomal protein S20
MASHKHAKKCIRKTARQTLVNKNRVSKMRTFVKNFEKLFASNKTPDKAEALAAFNEAQSELARTAGKGLVHRNLVARKVSRMAKQIKALG